MRRSEELELFLSRADEFIESQYILADVKIAGLLKAIAGSETLLALFKNCLNYTGFTAAVITPKHHSVALLNLKSQIFKERIRRIRILNG